MVTPMHTPMKNFPKHDRFPDLYSPTTPSAVIYGAEVSPRSPSEQSHYDGPGEAIVPFNPNRARVERGQLQIKADQIKLRKKSLGTRVNNRKDRIDRIKCELNRLAAEASEKRVKLAHESRLLKGNEEMLTKVDSELRDVNGMLASMPRYD